MEAPDAWQGRSLRPVVADAETDWRDSIVVDYGLYTAQRAVRTDRWKFIRTYHPGMWAGATPDRQLFDTTVDPWEQTDVSDEHPDIVAELETEMLQRADQHRSEYEDSLLRTAREGPVGSTWADFEGV